MSQDFELAGNWRNRMLPTASDSVFLFPNSTGLKINKNTTVKNFVVIKGYKGMIVLKKDLTVRGSLIFSGVTINGVGTLIISNLKTMNKETLVAFRVSLYDVGSPQQFYKDITPDYCIDKKWIPQTMGEQIWMWFNFADTEDKQKYIDWINACDLKYPKMWVGKDGITEVYPKNMFMHDDEFMTQGEINNWTK